MRAKILIAAVDKAGGIGAKGNLPWHISEDLKMFKRQTLNQVVVMGMTTFKHLYKESGVTLPNRQTVVITKDVPAARNNYNMLGNLRGYDLVFTDDLTLSNLPELKPDCNIFYCGGAKIYQQVIDQVDLILLSRIPQRYHECDTFFPTASTSTEGNWQPYLPKDFKLINAELIPEHAPTFRFETYAGGELLPAACAERVASRLKGDSIRQDRNLATTTYIPSPSSSTSS
jgi:dihydrofolate reductase